MTKFKNAAAVLLVSAVGLAPALAGTAPAAASPSAAGACTSWHSAYVPPGGKWIKSKYPCARGGYRGAKRAFSWATQPGTNAYVCAQAYGYNEKTHKWKWYSAGCGTQGTVKVPWGNTLAYPWMRFKSGTVLTGAGVKWRA